MLKNLMVRQGQWLFRWRSYLPLLVLPLAVNTFFTSGWVAQHYGAGAEDVWDVLCLLLALTGLSVRIMTVGFVPRGTSGRNTGKQQADALNTTGLYSVVRHPLYLGNFFVFMSFVLLLKSGLFAIFAIVIYLAYYERIILAEEEFLAERYSDVYRVWASKTPAFFPRLRGWAAPSLPFSWRSALRHEYHTVFLIGSVFFINELFESVVLEKTAVESWIEKEPLWTLLGGAAAVLYVAVMAIKKMTGWLDVADR